MKFLVEKVIKGEADKIIYVEFMRSRPTEIDELRTRMPSDRMRLYLIDYDRHPPFKGEKFDDRAGLPDPATRRFGLTGVQGMMVQTSDGIVQPLADRIHWITDGVTL